MNNSEKHDFNFWTWFWTICITIGIIIGIQNFDKDQILLCCLVLLPIVLLDIYFIRECFLEIKYILFSNKENK